MEPKKVTTAAAAAVATTATTTTIHNGTKQNQVVLYYGVMMMMILISVWSKKKPMVRVNRFFFRYCRNIDCFDVIFFCSTTIYDLIIYKRTKQKKLNQKL